MPTTAPIEIFNIARTEVDRDAVRRWLDFLGAEEFVIPDDQAVTDPALLVALAGKRCYKSFVKGLNPNVSKIRADYAEYFDNILASGHGSVLEHSVYTFAVENVSRVFTAEMNRHRAGWAISEASMRFIRFGEDIPYWEPDSVKGPDAVPTVESDDAVQTLGGELYDGSRLTFAELSRFPVYKKAVTETPIELKKQITRSVLKAGFGHQQYLYRVMEAVWADELKPESRFADKKNITSMMRRIVGMGCATGGVWTGNIRALRHVLTMRCDPVAEEEICHVFSRIAKMIKDREPLLFGDFSQDEKGYWRPKYKKV